MESHKNNKKLKISDYDLSIHQNPDAVEWAKFFITSMQKNKWTIDDIDEELMSGWFSNAMMAMHDYLIVDGAINGDHFEFIMVNKTMDNPLLT